MPVPSRVLRVLIVALYLVIFPYHPALRSPNELSRLWETHALVDHGTPVLNQTLRELGGVGDLSVVDGRYYPSKAPLLSFLAIPVYAGLKAWASFRGASGQPSDVPEVPLLFWARLFITLLPTLVMFVFLRRFLATYLSRALTEALVGTYALGSLAFNYAEQFLSHQLTAVLAFFCFYALWRSARGEWNERGYLLAGFFASATLVCEYTGALTVIALVFYGALSNIRVTRTGETRLWVRLARALALGTAGALPLVLALMYYHYICFGGPFESGYTHLADTAYQPWHMGGFRGIRYPDPRAFLLSFFSPLRGLLTMSPFLALGMVGLGSLWHKERPLFWLSALLLAANTYFTSSFSYDSWGWTPAPRHLTPLVPFLLLPAGLLMQRLSSREGVGALFGYGVATGLCVASILITGTVALVNYVPPELSTSLFGLAVPLFLKGFLVPTLLLFLGVPNPVSGALPVLLVLGGAVLSAVIFLSATGPRWRLWAPLGAVLSAGAMLLTLHSATRNDSADRGAEQFLERAWMAPPGLPVAFWPHG